MTGADPHQLVEAFLMASRALVGVAARSVADADEVTLPQFRALVLLAGRGPTMVSDLADALDIHTTSASRLCDRLAAKDLIGRSPSDNDRRQVIVSLTTAGEALVASVMDRRRSSIAAIVEQMDGDDVDRAIQALRAFAETAGEEPISTDALGWSLGSTDT